MITFLELTKNVTLSRTPADTTPETDIFNLSLVLAATGHSQRYLRTYVSSVLREVLQEDKLMTLHIVSIDPNSLASYLLPGRPTHVLTGITTKEGQRFKGLPAKLSWWKRGGSAMTAVVCLAGAALASAGWWGGGMALICLGTYFYRTFANLPDRPFWGHEQGA